MFKLAQSTFKPMATHTPKTTNPFAGAKSASPKIHTFATPENAGDNSYFSNLWSDIKSVGNGIGNMAYKVGDTFSRAAQGWNTLLSPYKGTPAQKMEWAGKAAKNVATDFVPGMFQGAINLPANMAKGISDIGTGVINSVTGGKFFNTAKQNVDNFTSKLTNPFKVDFKGNRTGVNAESFGVGEFAGETAASVGFGSMAKANKIETAVFKNNLNNFSPTRSSADIAHKMGPLKEKLGISNFTTYNKRADIIRNAMQQKYSTPGVVGKSGELWDGNTLYWLAKKNKVNTF